MTHTGKTKWSYCLDKMTPKQFNKLKVGDLLKIQQGPDRAMFVRHASMMSVFDVLPHPDSVFVVVNVELDMNETRVMTARAHYISGLGATGEAIITPHFAYGFTFAK